VIFKLRNNGGITKVNPIYDFQNPARFVLAVIDVDLNPGAVPAES